MILWNTFVTCNALQANAPRGENGWAVVNPAKNERDHLVVASGGGGKEKAEPPTNVFVEKRTKQN